MLWNGNESEINLQGSNTRLASCHRVVVRGYNAGSLSGVTMTVVTGSLSGVTMTVVTGFARDVQMDLQCGH